MLYANEQIEQTRECTITLQQAIKLLKEHDCISQELLDDFFNNLGNKHTYSMNDVLNWLGY